MRPPQRAGRIWVFAVGLATIVSAVCAIITLAIAYRQPFPVQQVQSQPEMSPERETSAVSAGDPEEFFTDILPADETAQPVSGDGIPQGRPILEAGKETKFSEEPVLESAAIADERSGSELIFPAKPKR